MSRSLRLLAAAGVTAVLAALIALGSSLPLPGDPPSDGLLRLDWRVRGEETGDCPRPTAEELAELPAHMRHPDACAGALPSYRLTVRIDAERVLDTVVRPGGLRGDRPLTVYKEISLAPGSRHVEIAFEPTGEIADHDAPPEADRAGFRRGGIQLSTEGTLEVEPGQVILAVRRQDTGELTLRSPVR